MGESAVTPQRNAAVSCAQWADASHAVIRASIDGRDCFVPDDPANADRRAIARWEASGSTIAAYVEPSAPVPDMISDRQFFQQLAIDDDITQAEALAAVQTGTLPGRMIDAIAQLPADQRFAAEMLLTGATQFLRSHPLTPTLGQMFGKDAAALDVLWRAAATL